MLSAPRLGTGERHFGQVTISGESSRTFHCRPQVGHFRGIITFFVAWASRPRGSILLRGRDVHATLARGAATHFLATLLGFGSGLFLKTLRLNQQLIRWKYARSNQLLPRRLIEYLQPASRLP